MKLDTEEIKRKFQNIEIGNAAGGFGSTSWDAHSIAEVIDNMVAEKQHDKPYQQYAAHVDALLELADNMYSFCHYEQVKASLEDAANAMATLIFENRRLQSELEEMRNVLHKEV